MKKPVKDMLIKMPMEGSIVATEAEVILKVLTEALGRPAKAYDLKRVKREFEDGVLDTYLLKYKKTPLGHIKRHKPYGFLKFQIAFTPLKPKQDEI